MAQKRGSKKRQLAAEQRRRAAAATKAAEGRSGSGSAAGVTSAFDIRKNRRKHDILGRAVRSRAARAARRSRWAVWDLLEFSDFVTFLTSLFPSLSHSHIQVPGERGLPLQKREAGIQLRKKTLLKEYLTKNKTNVFKDKRVGEYDPVRLVGLDCRYKLRPCR